MYTLGDMITFRIRPKFRGERCKFGKVLEKYQNYRFFDIFLDILQKMKKNLGQERVKRGLLSFQDKIGTIAPDFPGKMTVFFSFVSNFPLSLPGLLTCTKIIFLK